MSDEKNEFDFVDCMHSETNDELLCVAAELLSGDIEGSMLNSPPLGELQSGHKCEHPPSKPHAFYNVIVTCNQLVWTPALHICDNATYSIILYGI